MEEKDITDCSSESLSPQNSDSPGESCHSNDNNNDKDKKQQSGRKYKNIGVCHDDEVGNYVIAMRDFEPGQLIFCEKPMVSGPSFVEDEGFQVCLSCYSIVSTMYRCTKCNWAVCNLICQNDNKHSSFECPVLVRNKISPSKRFSSDCITILRCLILRITQPLIWKRIMSLESHVEKRRLKNNSTPLYAALSFLQHVECVANVQDAIIDRLIGILDTNGLGKDERQGPLIHRYSNHLFWYGSMMPHNCIPNAYRVITIQSQLRIYASTPIKKGTVLYVNNGDMFAGTKERHRFLVDNLYLSCKCERCRDPREMGVMFQAVKCQGKNCINGYLLPGNPLDDLTMWVCDSCDDRKPDQYVTSLKTKFRSELESVGDAYDLQSIKRLMGIVQRHRGITFHDNHFYIFQVQYDIVQRLSYMFHSTPLQDISQAFVHTFIDLTRKILAIFDVITPGFNRHRGRILYFLQQGLHRLILYKMEDEKEVLVNVDLKRELYVLFNEFVQAHNEAMFMLSVEPFGSEEHYLVQAMKESMDCMEKKIGRLTASAPCAL